MDCLGNVRVFARFRSQLPDTPKNDVAAFTVLEDQRTVKIKDEDRVLHTFTFDHCFKKDATQQMISEVAVEPFALSSMHGHNVCFVSYGQSGSGKTFTMNGTK